MTIKTNHGFMYEVRSVNIGDSVVFKSNGKEFSVEMQTNSFDTGDILSLDEEWFDKGDKIAFNIIDEIDTQALKLIESSQVSAN